jgi:hypothetical protein
MPLSQRWACSMQEVTAIKLDHKKEFPDGFAGAYDSFQFAFLFLLLKPG